MAVLPLAAHSSGADYDVWLAEHAAPVSRARALHIEIVEQWDCRYTGTAALVDAEGTRKVVVLRIEALPMPATTACAAAEEVVRGYSPDALVNHCLRSYIWGASLGLASEIAFDAELLFVSAMVHDIALEVPFDNYSLPFEEAGGHVAWVIGSGAGWATPRRVRAAEVIIRHMWDEVDRRQDPEGYLLMRATSLDISGRDLDEWPAGLRDDVVQRYPRLDLVDKFVERFEDQARRKPACLAARYISDGIAERLRSNPLNG